MTAPILAFTNTPVSKDQLIASIERHAAAGRGHHDFGEKTSGSSEYETNFGIPRMVAHLEDGIFKGLRGDAQGAWPLRFARAVPVSADLSMVGWKSMVDTLRHLPVTQAQACVDQVIVLLDVLIAGKSRASMRADFRSAYRVAYTTLVAAAAAADTYDSAAAYSATDAAAYAAAAAVTIAIDSASFAAAAAYAAADFEDESARLS